MIELQTVTTKAKNPSTDEFQDVTWGGINVISTSGTTNYNNLTNKPTINGVTVQGSLTTGDLLITAADVGALPSGTKYGADFALTIDSQTFVVTAQLKDQDGNNLGQAKTIDLPLETMVVGGRYDDTTQKVILTLKNGQTVEFSVANLVNGLQSEITLNNKLDADLIDDVSSRNKFVTSTEKSTWNGKQDTIADLAEIRSGAAAGATAVQQTAFDTDQARQETEIGVVANAGAKNLLKITAASQTIKGVTFTVNDDQTVTVNGTNDGTGASTFVIVSNAQAITIPDGNYILSGCPASGEGTATAPYDLRWYRYSQGKSAYDTGAGALVTKNGNTTDSNIAIVVKTGQTANNLIFKPMLRRAEITDDTFVPYAKTNRELTVAEDEDRAALIGQVDGGAKNLFNINATPIVNHTTYTLTDEKLTVSANGTWAHYSVPIDLPAGDYILSMTISDYSKASEAPNTSMRLRMSETTSGGTNVALSTITGNGNVLIPFTWTGGQIYLQFYPNYNATSYANSFSAEDVMICTAADYAISPAFVPYAKTNRELTVAEDEDRAALVAQVDGGSKNLIDTQNPDSANRETITPGSDGYVTAATTNRAWANSRYDATVEVGKAYMITIEVSSVDASQAQFQCFANAVDGETQTELARSPRILNAGTYILNFVATTETVRLAINLNNSATIASAAATYRVLFCTAADYAISPAFVPYAKTNRELTVAEDEDRTALIGQVDGGAKNFLDTSVSTLKKYNTASSAVWNGSSYTQNGITYSVNSDGTISVSGTATSTSFLVLANRTYLNTKITRGRYSISGCPTGGGSSGATYRIFCLNPNANISNGYTDTGNGYIGEFYYDDSKDCNISIGIGKGCVITDPIVFKPMLCTATDYKISPAFVPYRPSWQEMYDMIKAMQNGV